MGYHTVYSAEYTTIKESYNITSFTTKLFTTKHALAINIAPGDVISLVLIGSKVH